MAWKTLAPPAKNASKLRAKLGTISRGGVPVRGALSFTGDLLANFADRKRCSIAVDETARKLQVIFTPKGPFQLLAIGKSAVSGGGRVFLPMSDWLPPAQFRAIEIAIEKINGDELLLALPAQWPEPPPAAE